MSEAAARLRAMVAQGRLVRAMAAHSALSARLAHEAEFDAVWASGFELSALHGLADASLLSMADHVAAVRAMAARCAAPIVADLDTGFGNAINVIHAVREFARAGAAAVVIEDKQFPKTTSLREGGRQPLVRVEEFAGKLEAARHAAGENGPIVIGRTEALIAGAGMDEALRRADAYVDAGAELVLVHSKRTTPDEVEAFIASWKGRAPLVLVPTSYPQLSERRIAALGKVGMIIYGNHAIRASVRAMRETFRAIREAGGAMHVQDAIASVEEVFALQDMARVADDERRFLR